MTINRASVSTTDITEIKTVSIEMLDSRPDNAYTSIVGTPNALCGYYDAAQDLVELFIRDSSGFRYIKLI